MKINFTPEAKKQYLFWSKKNKKILKQINILIKAIQEEPFNGIGKPEPLKYDLSGYWSRRIDGEHRLVYRIENDELFIIYCKYHYK